MSSSKLYLTSSMPNLPLHSSVDIENLLSNATYTDFNVYVEDGNNSELIKVVVRKRTGWRVVESPAVANMIWSQFYRPAVDAKLKGRIIKSNLSSSLIS